MVKNLSVSHFLSHLRDFLRCLQYSPRKRLILPLGASRTLQRHRQLYQHLFHAPKFREAILEISGCPQLTSHLNSSELICFFCILSPKRKPKLLFPSPYVPPAKPQGLGYSMIQCLEQFLSWEIFPGAPPESDSSFS